MRRQNLGTADGGGWRGTFLPSFHNVWNCEALLDSTSHSHSILGKCHYWHPDLVSNLGGIFASKLSQVHLRGRILRLIGSKPVTQDRLHIFLLILTLTTSLYTYQTLTLVSAIRKTSSLNVWMYECMLMWTIMYGGNQWPQERGLRK